MSSSLHRYHAAALFFALNLCACTPSGTEAPASTESVHVSQHRHIDSPDWRDQIIYFVMIDRFNDGDASNNDQGTGEFDPNDPAKFSGGDLAGVIQQLDYIKGLGATALWMTPPVANQWWDGMIQYGGYHGYWAENFKAIDAHFGQLQDYQQLAELLHRQEMYLIHDVVVNHTGNFFDYNGPYDAADPTQNFFINDDSTPVKAPTQPPFHLNDLRNPEHREAGIYHWTPIIRDFADIEQEKNWQLSNLDDLNTDNPVVRRALRDSYGYWIKEVGVDAFRIDTAFYVYPEFFHDFMYSDDPDAPGVMRVAEQTGRKQFHLFGEGFGIDRAFDDSVTRKIDGYMRDETGRKLLPGMVNFPLYGTIQDVFIRGRPTSEMRYRIETMMKAHEAPHLMSTFVDNHDVERFLASGDIAGFKQALTLIMTLPGIPTLYYGTEQLLTEQRAAMFAGGYQSGGKNHFDRQAPMYTFLQELIALRKHYPALRRGIPTLVADNPAAPGALAYLMEYQQQTLLIMFNTDDQPTLMSNVQWPMKQALQLKEVFSSAGTRRERKLKPGQILNQELAPREFSVWEVMPTSEKSEAEQSSTSATLSIDPLPSTSYVGDVVLEGSITGVNNAKLLLNGNLAEAIPVQADSKGRWQHRLDTSSMINPNQTHRVVLWSEKAAVASSAQEFSVKRQWQPILQISDVSGDDKGPFARYRYPLDASWGASKGLDIENVSVFSSGSALKVSVKMADLVAAWNPVNGFDHLVLTMFIEMPGRDAGARVMPFQNAELPDNMHWHYRLRTHGWSNALFSAKDAGTQNEGSPVSPGAEIDVDRNAKTITVSIPAKSLGQPASLSGVKLYLNSWDYGEGYRPLGEQPTSHDFGGGRADEPRWMDQTKVIVLP